MEGEGEGATSKIFGLRMYLLHNGLAQGMKFSSILQTYSINCSSLKTDLSINVNSNYTYRESIGKSDRGKTKNIYFVASLAAVLDPARSSGSRATGPDL